MKIRQAIFHNFCQHEYMRLEFQDGVTFITGPCGAGKSNSFRGIRGTITGDFSTRKMGGKQHDLCYAAAKNAEATVETVWALDDGRSFSVRRNITKTGSARLIVDGSDDLNGVEAVVTEAISKLTGYSTDVFMQCMFIQQGQISDIFNKTPAEISAQLICLTNADLALQLTASLAQLEASDKIRLQDYDDARFGVAQNDYLEAKKSYSRFRDEHAELASTLLPDKKVKQLQEIVNQRQAYIDMAEKFDKQSELIKQLKSELKLITADEQKTAESIKQLRARIDEESDALSKQQKRYFAFSEHDRNYAAYKNAIADRDAEVPELEEPPNEPDLLSDEALKDLQEEQRSMESVIRMHADKACVTCKRPFEVTDEEAAQAEQRLEDIEAQISAHQIAAEKLRKYVQRVRDHKRDVAQHEKTVKKAKEQIKLIPKEHRRPAEAIEEPSDAPLRKLKANLQTKLQEHEEQLTKKGRKEGELLQAEGHAINLTREMSQLRGVSVEDAAKAKKVLRRNESRLLKVKESAEELNRFRNNWIYHWKYLRSQMVERRKMLRIGPTLAIVSEALKVCKRLPALTIAELARQMEPAINDKLAALGMDFTLSVNDALNFTVTRHGYEFPHSRLSGGQRCVAALAFWMTVADVIGINSMFMDEPIDGFDPMAEAMLPDVFESIHAICKRDRRQLIVITHHHQLANIGNRINIGA